MDFKHVLVEKLSHHGTNHTVPFESDALTEEVTSTGGKNGQGD